MSRWSESVSDTAPLVGIRLLDGYGVRVDVEDGGRVVVEPTASRVLKKSAAAVWAEIALVARSEKPMSLGSTPASREASEALCLRIRRSPTPC